MLNCSSNLNDHIPLFWHWWLLFSVKTDRKVGQREREGKTCRVVGWKSNLQPLQEECSLNTWAACLNR